MCSNCNKRVAVKEENGPVRVLEPSTMVPTQYGAVKEPPMVAVPGNAV
jgi:hypothetical protein